MLHISLRFASFSTITNATLGTVALSKCSILIAEARLTILDRLVLSKNVMRSGAFDKESLINSMANIDNFVTDNSPVVDRFFKKYDAKYQTD